MEPPNQVGLAVRKTTAASIPFARMMGGEKARSFSRADSLQLNYLTRSFSSRLETAFETSAPTEDLDSFIAAQSSYVGTLIPTCTAPLSPAAEQVLRQTLVDVGEARCASCPGRQKTGNGMCQDSASDRVTMAEGAACLREITEALDFARDLAERLLEDALGVACPLDVRLATTFWEDGRVTASCRHIDAGRPMDLVTLSLPPRGFVFADLAKVPYLFAHEIICHASQGRHGFKVLRPSSGQCPWTEGWMDCLAAEAVSESLLAGERIPAWIREEDSGIENATRMAHDARSSLVVGDWYSGFRYQAARAWWEFGRAAALMRMSETSARLLRRRFSIIYNASADSSDQRNDVGVRLGAGMTTGSAERIVTSTIRLVETGDIAAFKADLPALG